MHKDLDNTYGLIFPNFPGRFPAADELADLPRMAQEAAEVHFEGEEIPILAPSSPEQWAGDERFQGGYWMRVDIDPAPSRRCAPTPETAS